MSEALPGVVSARQVRYFSRCCRSSTWRNVMKQSLACVWVLATSVACGAGGVGATNARGGAGASGAGASGAGQPRFTCPDGVGTLTLPTAPAEHIPGTTPLDAFNTLAGFS